MKTAHTPMTTGPLPTPVKKYNALSELRDLVLHLERYSVSLKAGLYQPIDNDFEDLATQIMVVAQQLKEFSIQKAHLIYPKEMY